MTYLAGMYAALCDEKSTGPLQGPVQLLEPRVDLLIQEPDTFFEQGLLVWGQHGNDPASKRRPVAKWGQAQKEFEYGGLTIGMWVAQQWCDGLII